MRYYKNIIICSAKKIICTIVTFLILIKRTINHRVLLFFVTWVFNAINQTFIINKAMKQLN